MKKITFYLLLSSLLFILPTGCKKKLDKTIKQSTFFSGNIIKGITVNGPWEVDVIQDSTNNYIVLEYSAFAEEKMEIELDNHGYAHLKYNHVNIFGNDLFLKATIYATSLENITISNAADVSASGSFYGFNVGITMSDASRFNYPKFIVNSCNINIYDASTFSGNIRATDIKLNLSDASQFQNSSAVIDRAIITAEDASTVNMLDTEVRVMDITLKKASTGKVFVTEKLTFRLSDVSHLYYKGNPILNEIDVIDGSFIHHLP